MCVCVCVTLSFSKYTFAFSKNSRFEKRITRKDMSLTSFTLRVNSPSHFLLESRRARKVILRNFNESSGEIFSLFSLKERLTRSRPATRIRRHPARNNAHAISSRVVTRSSSLSYLDHVRSMRCAQLSARMARCDTLYTRARACVRVLPVLPRAN